ncbi:15192_t:CDS:1, partial [Dentiscutata erythropus]
ESSKQKENIIKTNQISKHYHTIVESDNGSEIEYDSDPQIEFSAHESEDKFSELDSDDSDYTHQQKKGKFKVNEKQKPANKIHDIDAIQEIIIANHKELNINGKRKHDFDNLIDENELFDDNISDVEEEFKIKKTKI